MYNYNLYRLIDTTREKLREQVAGRLAQMVEPPLLGGFRPDLATSKRVFFIAEDSDRIAACAPALNLYAEAGHEVILAVPEPLKEAGAEAWSYLPDHLRARVKVLPVPMDPPKAGE